MTHSPWRVAIDLRSPIAVAVGERGGARVPGERRARTVLRAERGGPRNEAELVRQLVLRLAEVDGIRPAGQEQAPRPDELLLVHPPGGDDTSIAELLRLAEGLHARRVRAVPGHIAVAHHCAHADPPPIGTGVAVVEFGAASCGVGGLRREADGSFAPLPHRDMPGLGSDALDRLVLDWAERQLGERGETELLGLLVDPTAEAFAQRIARRAGEAREALGEMPVATVLVDSDRRRVALEITRSEFEELAEAALAPVAEALRIAAAETPGGLAAVHLSGAGARLPVLAAVIQRSTGLLPAVVERPDAAAAIGALLVPRADPDAADEPPPQDLPTARGPRDETARRVSEEILHLTAAVEALLGDAAASLASELRERAERVPRVAVVGRVKAGKSTLVNAVIGRRAAPTDDRECTLVVTRYQYGAPERCEVLLRTGESRSLPLENGGLPADLGAEPGEIEHATVHLSCDALRDFTLIDTPGLASTTERTRETARRYLFGERQTENADAIVYVFRHAQFADDSAALRALAISNGAIGVLSFADVHTSPWGEDDPLEHAAADAAAIAAATPELATVIPLAGRLAEAATAGLIRESDASALASYTAVDTLDLELGAVDDAEGLERLSSLLGEYGLRHGRAVAGDGAASLRQWARSASGIDDLARELAARSIGRYHHLIAHSSLRRLEALARELARMDALGVVQQARQQPHMHGVVELEAMIRLAEAVPQHPLLDELALQLDARNDGERVRAPAGSDAAEIRSRALAAAGRARTRASVSIDPREEFALRTLIRSYALIADRSAAS